MTGVSVQDYGCTLDSFQGPLINLKDLLGPCSMDIAGPWTQELVRPCTLNP